MPVKPKSGPMSREEREWILANAVKMTPEEIAEKLGRNFLTISKFIKENYIPPKTEEMPREEKEEHEKLVIRQELRNSESWKILKEEFSPNELKFFEESFIRLMSQFQGNVLASEEIQVVHSIKFEMLMSRNLKARQKALQDIERLESQQKLFMNSFGGDPSQMTKEDRDFAFNLENQLNIFRSSAQSYSSEYVKFQERHSDLMKTLKATRDARVKMTDSGTKDFLSVIRMLQDKDVQKREGREMALMKLAAERSYNELGQYHRFEDGVLDKPILSSDTIDLGEEEEKKDDKTD